MVQNSATIVLSGRDNATFYRYLILDDITEAPTNWFESNLMILHGNLGQLLSVIENHDELIQIQTWNTDGNSPYEDDVILVRHKFQMSGIVTSAQIDVAFANYCTPYLNGNIIYDERGGSSHVQEYWNDDGTEDISASSFLKGQNVLAVFAETRSGLTEAITDNGLIFK